MIVYKRCSELGPKELNDCKTLINANFAENRFDYFTHVISYTVNNEIVGFIGIYDNLLNQLCTKKEYRKKGIASQILMVSKKVMKSPIYLFVDKNKENTSYLINFYISNDFKVFSENEIEYKMIFDNRIGFGRACFEVYHFFTKMYDKLKLKLFQSPK